MTQFEAAHRIVEIQRTLLSRVLGMPVRCELVREQSELWNDFFPGEPYEVISSLDDPNPEVLGFYPYEYAA